MLVASYGAGVVEISVAGDRIEVVMKGADAVWAFKRRIHVPVRDVQGVHVTDDLRPFLSIRGNQLGLRLPGTAVPGVVVAGSYRRRGSWTFCCLHRRQRALVVDLRPSAGRYDRLVLGVDDPEGIRDAIEAARTEAG